MDRRNFLAYIPAAGAVPFVASDILIKDDKIEVVKPEIIKSVKEFNGPFDLTQLELQVVDRNGNLCGRGWVEQLSLENEFLGPRSISVSGKLINLLNYSI